MTLVSVVVPMRDRRALIVETLQSALAQTHRPIELIVVDDGSTDGSGDLVAETFGDALQLIRLERNHGRSTARNIGCEAARGEFVAFLDSDDLWDPPKLARQLALFADPDVVLTHCRVRQIDATGAVRSAATAAITRAFEAAERRGYDYGGITATWCRMYTPAVVVRREVLARTGGFDPALDRFEDWDLFWRIAKEGRVATVPETLVSVRVHEGNIEPPWSALAAPFIRVAEKHLAALEEDTHRTIERGDGDATRAATLRRARHNLLMQRALGELWRGDRPAARRWLVRALRDDPRPLLRPWHPTWGALLLHAALPEAVAETLARALGVDRYVGRATARQAAAERGPATP
jgi:glycosyltransferase involved in cell wall biosynthesis